MELATIDNKQVAIRATVDDQLPGWIQYLIGAYPQQKPNKMTFAVLESQFQEYGNDIMLQAVKGYVTKNKYWPVVSELKEYIKLPQEGHNIPFYIWHTRSYAPKYWHECKGCGELSPNLDDCPFCEDIAGMEHLARPQADPQLNEVQQ